MTNNQVQVTLSAFFGDGCISFNGKKSVTPRLQYSSINKDYMEFKKELLGDLSTGEIVTQSNLNSTYSSRKPIHTLVTRSSKEVLDFLSRNEEENLKLMDELGLALWFYDDGSLHKTKHFYNLNTHSFSKELQEDVFIPHLSKFGLEARTRLERKKDGREYTYLYIPPHKGGKIVNKLLKSYPVTSMLYKTWSSETISKESKVQENLKSTTL